METVPDAYGRRRTLAENKLIVIGASLGGVAAIPALLSAIPRDFSCPILVTMHIDAHRSQLPMLLAQHCAIPASHAVDGEMLASGHIYVAPPDQHMLIDGPLIHLKRSAREHHCRPAIDPMFRSAALSRGSDVIGVVLTGMLSDGTFGLQAIKEAGGIAIVQDPKEAVEPSMPRAALRYVDVDYCLPLLDIPAKLQELVPAPRTPRPWQHRRDVETEHALFLKRGNTMEQLESIAVPSMFVCPECKGGLWSLNGANPPRFRCHTGHAYGLETLEHSQSTATDDALWTATRGVQEKIVLMEQIARQRRSLGAIDEAVQIERDLDLVRHHLDTLMAVVTAMPGSAARI
jgi:two-component system chemotaxis response regulator CheB